MGSIPVLGQWVQDLVLLSTAVAWVSAAALIKPLAWELLRATGVTVKKNFFNVLKS